MRYNSVADGTMLRRKSLGPDVALARRQYALPIPGRGEQAGLPRYSLRGFGASSFGPPVGAGAGAGAATGASQGASIGSAIVPGIGTAIGAVVGAIGGAIAGSINKVDPEQYNFDQAVAVWQQNPDAVYAIGNKYLPLAGLFDLNIKTNIPIYRKFGHMGEQAFVTAMVQQLYAAAQAGKITANDTPVTIFNNVIQPWIDSWGYGPMSDPHADLINRLMIGMIYDWVTGAWRNAWFARGGDFPFGSLPSFPGFTTPSVSLGPTNNPTPSQVTSAPSNAAGGILQQVRGIVNATVPNSPDGTYVTWDSQHVLQAAGITWAYASTIHGPTGAALLTNGQDVGMRSLLVTVAGGVPYTVDAANQWYYYGNGKWNVTGGAPPGFTMPSVTWPSWILTNTPATPTAPPAPTTPSPPTIGAPITSGLDSATNKLVALPAGAQFGGLTSTGAWIIQYPTGANAGSYTIVNGVLTPYGTLAPSTSGTTIPAGYKLSGQSIVVNGQTYPLYTDPVGNQYVWSGSQMIPYSNAPSALTANTTAPVTGGGGGGGGGFSPGWSTPTQSQAQSVAGPVDTGGTGFSPLLLLGGAAALYFLLEG